MSTSALLLVNRASGRQRGGELAVALAAAVRAAGFTVATELIATPAEAREQAAAAARGGRVRTVVVCGGDGTIRGAAAGLLGSEVALAPLPGGTTNVVAAAFGYPPRPLLAAAALRGAVARDVDVGLCDGEPFLMQVSVGLDARIMAGVTSRMKTRFGKGAVVARGLVELFTYDFPAIEVEVDGRHHTATHVAVCNLPQYGGGFRLAPQGSCEDRQLELVLFTGRGIPALLRYGFGVLRSRHAALAGVTVLPITAVTILGPPAATVQVDGDALATPFPARGATRRRAVADARAALTVGGCRFL